MATLSVLEGRWVVATHPCCCCFLLLVSQVTFASACVASLRLRALHPAGIFSRSLARYQLRRRAALRLVARRLSTSVCSPIVADSAGQSLSLSLSLSQFRSDFL